MASVENTSSRYSSTVYVAIYFKQKSNNLPHVLSSINMLRIPGVIISGPMNPQFEEILTVEAIQFLVELHTNFEPTRKALLRERERRQKDIANGIFPDFIPETRRIREVLGSDI